MVDRDMDKQLSDKISEKQDIVNQLREDEKRGTFINNTSQSCSEMGDAQQGFDESKDDFFNSIKSNDDSQFKPFDGQEEMIYHSFFELFPDGIFVLDLKGFIQSCNAAVVTLLGYSKKEIIGHKFSEMSKYDEKGIEAYLNIFDSIIQGNIIDPFELKLQKKDKTLFTAEIRARVLTQNDKKIGIQVIARKINDIKIQEEKVKECKDSFQRIFSIIPDMISVHDKEMNIIYSNWKGFADIPEEKRILNTKCYNTYRGLDQICPDCKAETVLNAKESIQAELELPEGVWVDLRVLPLVDENDDVELFVEWVRDITKRKETEQVLRESEEKNRSIVEIVPDIIFQINKNGEYIDIRTSSEGELAKPKEDLLKKNIKDVFTSDVSSLILDTIRKAIATSEIQVIEYELAVPSGKRSFEGRILRLGEDEVIAFVRDITEKKKIEIELQENKDKLENLIKSSSEFIWQVDKNGVYTNVSDGVEKIMGYNASEVIGKTPFDFMKPSEAERVGKIFSEIIKKTERINHLEDAMIHKNGHLVFFETDGMPLFDEQGEFNGYLGTCRDITEKKKSQKALSESERKYRRLYEAQVNGFAIFKSIFNEQGEFISYEFMDINPAYEQITGVKREEVTGKDIQEVFPGTEQSWIDSYGSVAMSGESKTFEMYHEPTKKYYYCNVFRPWDDNKRFCVAFNDITERKRSEIKVKKSEEKYHTLFDTMAQGVVYQDVNGEIISANPSAERILGLTRSQMQGTTSLHPRWKAVDKDKHELSGENHPAMVALKTGEEVSDFLQGIFNPEKNDYVWIIVNSVPQFKDGSETPYQVYSTFLDVTERVNAEMRLKETLNATTDGIWTWDFKTDTLFFSDQYYQMLGYQPQEFKATFENWINLIHPEDRKQSLAVAQEYLKQKPDIYENNFRMKTKQGDYRWIRAKAKVVQRDENGEALRMIGNHEDITEQKKSQRILRESEQKYRLIFEMSPIGITTADKKGRIIDINESGANITGHSREELIGKKYNEINFIDRKVLFKIVKNFSKIIKGEPLDPIEMDVVDLQGETHIVEVRISPIRDNGKFSGTQIMMQDITERKKAEEEIQQTNVELKELNQTLEQKVEDRTERINQLLKQKDEFINQLGHDLKNPLGPFLQLLPILDNHIYDEKDKRMIRVLTRNANYMRNLVKKNIDLAKLNSSKNKFTFENVSLGNLVEEVVAVNDSLFDENDVVVEINVSSDCLVLIDPLHIEEVFTNLFNNAVKYSDDKGWIGIDAVEKDNFVLVSVSDRGIGVSEEQLPFLFDEYYKADSSRHDFDSSGLGLPICKRIIEKHGGHIWVESDGLGRGSTFHFTLPLNTKQVEEP